MGIFIKSGILHTLKFHLHTLSCHFWLNLCPRGQDLPNAWFCRACQSHSCEKKAPHDDVLPSGLAVSVEHFCAACYAKDKKKAFHARTDAVCPHKTAWLGVDDNGGGSKSWYCVRNDTGPCSCRPMFVPGQFPCVKFTAVCVECCQSRGAAWAHCRSQCTWCFTAGAVFIYACRSSVVQISRGVVFLCLPNLTSTISDRNPKIILTGMSLIIYSLAFPSTALVSTVQCLWFRITREPVIFLKLLTNICRRNCLTLLLLGHLSKILSPYPATSIPWILYLSDSDERRIIVDLSFPKGDSVNATIPKNSYLGEPFHLTFPTVDALIAMVKHKGQGCALFKRDLQWAYRQIPVEPGDIHHLGYKCGQVFEWIQLNVCSGPSRFQYFNAASGLQVISNYVTWI